MKKPALLLALLLLALSCSDGTLLARGRSRTKKNRDQTSGEAPYVCLDAPIDLPACTFSAEAPDGETRDKLPRHRRGLSETLAAELNGEDASSNFGDNRAKSRDVVVVYKIERCIPSRLPFDLPICKEEDSVGRIVEVRRLFPFNVMGLSGYNAGTTLVFPEVDVDQWHRFVHGPWTRPAIIEDIVDKVDGANGKNSRTELGSAGMPKTPKRKKVDSSISTNEKKKKTMLRKLKKFDRRHLSRKIDVSDVFTELPTFGKLQVIDDRRTVDPVSSYETRADRFNRMDDHHQQRDGENIDPLAVEKASFASRADEFLHAKAIPHDPEKLRVPRTYSEFPYREAIVREPISARRDGNVEDEKFNGEALRLDDLPYAQLITYYPEEADSIGAGGFPHNPNPQRGRDTPHSGAFAQKRAIGRSNRMLVEGDHNYGSPYAKLLRVPQDRTKLEIAKASSEFHNTRAIAYDPAKPRVASRGSEFPYAKAIPYDPKKLFEEPSRGIIDIRSSSLYSRGLKEAEDESKSSNARAVPFDSRMLDAAKEGRIFPYGKAIPDDTSRIVEGMDLSRSRNTESIEAPVRHAKTLRSERVPTYTSSRQIGKDERRLEDILNDREVRRNIINSENEDYLYELPMQGRVTRRAMEPDAPGDTSFDDDNSEAPRRWSEFPYSKAIPFDPSKLRRPRSTVEDYVKTSIVAPQDFPYAKAIPYDPWKFAGFRRKKSEARAEQTIDDESKLLAGLKLSRLARFIF